METSSIFLLSACGVASFGLGRTFVYFRDKKRKQQAQKAHQQATEFRLNQPPEAESKNKSKRKRQLHQFQKESGKNQV